MSSAHSESFTSFPIWIPFIYFSSLSAVAKNSKTVFNSSRESGNPCLVFAFRGNAVRFSPLKIMFAVSLSYIYSFSYVEVCSFYACFPESFYHKWMLNFVKGFLCIYWDNHMAFIFQFVNVVYHIDWFADIKESLYPWDKAHLVMMVWFFFKISCWILFARILLRIFASMFISDIGL